MLSSKQLMDLTGISRATLNNYVAAGLLPQPEVRAAGPGDGQARRLGYFPETVLDTLREIGEHKREGYSMAQIVELLNASRTEQRPRSGDVVRPIRGAEGPVLTLDNLDSPAYLVNYRFEIEWCNPRAQELILDCPAGLPPEISARALFPRLLRSPGLGDGARESVLEMHMAIARHKLSKSALLSVELDSDERRRLDALYDAVEPVTSRSVCGIEVDLAESGSPVALYGIYASFFREGILFVYSPIDHGADRLLAWLSRRDAVIRDVLRKRPPCLTPLAVLVADLQDSVKICSELPPEEYFELINQIWSRMEPLLREFHATHGKHVGDGMVYYFFPQPDSDYVLNSLLCAERMKREMTEISRIWRARKNWLNELRLNFGIDEGEEWFGTYQTASYFEFTVLGDTVNRAARLSDFARQGSIWVTKNTLGKLPGATRARVRYGIRRNAEGGEQVLVPSTYARIVNLCDLTAQSKFNDIATIPVTELLDISDER